MRLLLSVFAMAHRSGAEWFVRDLAIGLNQLGHSVTVYAPVVGDMVDELRWRSIACVTDLAQMAAVPDLVIGSTRDETVACLARFPGVPAISICHDRVAQHGLPPLFSRIRQYVAVDANCAERLTLENGIPASGVVIIQNGVDLERFRPRLPLPQRPHRAAIFSNYATDNADTQLVRAVCNKLGIALEVVGSGVGRQARAPETVLAEFDLVFAKARCAMEAMATGCAVLLLNEGMGMAGLVRSTNVENWHLWNFGRKLLQQPIDASRLETEILAYSAEDACAVTAYMRHAGSLATTANAFAALAENIHADERFAPGIDLVTENREFASHLARNLQPFGAASESVQAGMLAERLTQAESSNNALLAANRRLQEDLAMMHGNLAAMHQSLSWKLTAPLRWLGDRLGR